MTGPDARARYRDYLRTFGIAEPDARLAELTDLDLGRVRFFAYAGDEGLRLKAAVTPGGLVTPGAHPDDDWHGFLAALPDALTAAGRIAWLETDDTPPPHALPPLPCELLASRPPQLLRGDDGAVTLVAWFLPSGSRTPERWTIRVRPGEPAAIERRPAEA